MFNRHNFFIIPLALSAICGFGGVSAQVVYMPPSTQYEPSPDKEINVPALTEQEESAFIKRLKAAQNTAPTQKTAPQSGVVLPPITEPPSATAPSNPTASTVSPPLTAPATTLK